VSEPLATTRGLRLTQLVASAAECLRLRNYNGVMELVGALSTTAVAGLACSWSHVPPTTLATLAELQALMSADGNFRAYRAALVRVIWLIMR
jgi:hypothetical protein